MLRAMAIAALASLTLAACGTEQPQASNTAATAPVLPADPALASLYQQTCMACHTRPASGAPQTGNGGQWAPRLAKGKDVLLDNTINGYRGMPPLGSCMDCGEEDFAALIDFMATPQ